MSLRVSGKNMNIGEALRVHVQGKVAAAVGKYFDGEPVIKDIKRVSTPGRRVYSSVKDLPTVANGLGVSILSTPKGVMSDSQARTENVGGEILCSVF